MVDILIFGDSIVYGKLDKEGGWAQRLRKFLDSKKFEDEKKWLYSGDHIYVLGIDGDTSTGLLKRFEREIKPRTNPNEEPVIIIGIGINDSCFVRKMKKILVPEKQFETNIKKLIKISKKFSSKIIFLGLTPVEEEKVNPLPTSTTGKSYNNENIKKYNDIIKKLCERNDIMFIEIFDKFIKSYKKLLADGLHPNSEGHKKIFEVIKDFLIKNKIVEI